MDVCETNVPDEKNNGTTCQPRTREASARYLSPTPRRFPSPITRTVATTSVSTSKRAVSAERRRPVAPSSLSGSSIPVHDSSVVTELVPKKVISSKFPESLWPSRMRNLNVMFQPDKISLPINKGEKPLPQAFSDRTLKPSLNVAQKQTITSPHMPDIKRSPLKGKNVVDQSENSGPLDGLHARLIDQHLWPGRTGSNVLSKSIDLHNKATKTSITPNPGVVVPSLRRTSLPDYSSKPLQKSTLDSMRLLSSLADMEDLEFDNLKRISNPISSSPSEETTLVTPAVRSHSLSMTGSQPSSQNKPYGLASRGVNPSRTRGLSPSPSRGVSPSPTPSRGVSYFPTPSRGVSSSPAHASTREVSPTPARGVSPPTARGVSPSTPARGVSPTRDRGVSPPTPTGGVSPSPAYVKGVSSSHAPSRGVSPSPAPARGVSPARDRGVSPPNPTRGVSPSPSYVRGVNSSHAPSRGVSPSSPAPARVVSPARDRGASPSPTPTRGVSPTPAYVRGVSSSHAPSRGVSLSPALARCVSPSPAPARVISPTRDRGVSPSPTPARGVSPSPAPTRVVSPTRDRGVSPSPTLARGVNPSPAHVRGVSSSRAPSRGVSPSLAPARGVSPSPAPARVVSPTRDRGVSPSPAPARVVSPTRGRGVSPSPTPARGVSPSPTPARGVSLSSAHVRGVSPSPTPARGVSPSRERGVSPSPTPARGVSPYPTPARGVSPSAHARGVSPSPATSRGVSSSLATSREVSPPARVRGVSPSPANVRGVSPPALARGVSPSPTPFKAASPSRIRSSSPLRQSCDTDTVSVVTFVADITKAKKALEDAHYLRLLYSRLVQWRFINATAEAEMYSQKVTAEESLFNVWSTTSELWDSVATMKIDLYQLGLQLKLYSVLNRQTTYLNEWVSIEREQDFVLSGAIKDLQATTLRLPLTMGAKADINSVKLAVSSAVQVMQKIGSSMQSSLSMLEGTSGLVSQLASVAALERALLDECQVLLDSTASLQVGEYSLRTHLVQLRQS